MKYFFISIVALVFLGCSQLNTKSSSLIELNNPILPGYFADPSLVEYEGKFYMYVTADPWGTDFLSCWESDDFQNWTFHKLNWPTKEACVSPTSRPNKVWAPSVIQKDGKFYMYVSVGSEVWCGVAEHPLGPWKNMLGENPFIPDDTTGYYHVIDAEAFIDADGKVYLYWGSGWEWINGHCFGTELDSDMCSFKTTPVELTPSRYFEAPFMIANNGKYYLTYSEGKTIDETYEVRYAVGESPLGSFIEAANSPILKTNDSLQVYGPGHHTMFTFRDKNYILYHRHRLPFGRGSAYRQTCIGEFTFNNAKDEITDIIPEHTQIFPKLNTKDILYISPEYVKASSCQDEFTEAENVLDTNYGTRWEALDNDKNSSILFAFNKQMTLKNMEIRFEYPWKDYFFKIETSMDNENWEMIADFTTKGASGSPVNIPIAGQQKYARIVFVENPQGAKPSIWEVRFR